MKTLLIVRHAKSSWDSPGVDDFDRPLLEKGKKLASKAIDYLQNKKVLPDLILTSSARRALDTAILFSQGLGIPFEKITEEKRLYYAEAEQILDFLFDLPPETETVMIVGHNPTLTNFVNRYLDDKIDVLPTSGVVALKLNTDDWLHAGTCSISVDFMVFPKML
jgi:phosphohistidine phosphatase